MEKWPLGVFASIDAGFGVHLDIAKELGVRTIHLHTPQQTSRTSERVEEFKDRLAELDIRVTCVFAGFEGESYADIPTVQQTVGLVPPETRAQRTAEFYEIADFAKSLGVDVVGIHIGFVPHEPSDPTYGEMVELTRQICDRTGENNQAIHLETGQEPADVLLEFLETVDRPNLFINFDPANMILYGCGEPIEALKKVGRYVRSVHCKDGRWSDEPGKTWGEETPLGEGDVDFTAYLKTLDEFGYDGPLTIEREIPQEPDRQKAEIAAACQLLERLKSEVEQES